MIEINLINAGEQRRTARPSIPRAGLPKLPTVASGPNTLVAAAGLAALLWVAYTLWALGGRTAELNASLERELSDSTALAATISRAELLRARQDTIRKKIEVIQSVDQRRFVWPHLLDEVSRALPAFTWLSKLNTSAAADTSAAGPAFNLEGNAGSTQALTRFMKNLEASPYVQGVTLVTTQQQVAEGRAFQKFTLEARYEQPAVSAIRTVPVVAAP